MLDRESFDLRKESSAEAGLSPVSSALSFHDRSLFAMSVCSFEENAGQVRAQWQKELQSRGRGFESLQPAPILLSRARQVFIGAACVMRSASDRGAVEVSRQIPNHAA